MSLGAPASPHATTPAAISLSAFIRLLRQRPTSLDAYIGEFGLRTTLPSTCVTVHCRHLLLDGNNTPRVKDLANRLAQELVNYAIPRSNVVKARTELDETGSAHLFSMLHRKAARLFTTMANTGECGELLLYMLTETYLRFPQLFCKMPLKTNPKVHYHGVDGIHGHVDSTTGTLALYWGESKLYQSYTHAIDSCFSSLAPFLIPDGSSDAPQSRDIELLADNIDLADEALESAIARYLDADDPQYNKLSYHGVALVGFDTDSYTSSAALSTKEIKSALETSTSLWHKSVTQHVVKHNLTKINIEMFCIPFPSVEEFRAAVLKELK